MEYNKDLKSCAFSGHRPSRFVFKHNETHTACIELKQAITKQIENLYFCGVKRFYTGCAIGVDIWAGEAVLLLAKQRPDMELHCIVPYRGQESEWTSEQQIRYRTLLSKSTSMLVLNEAYSRESFFERNRFLVDNTDMLLAVYDGSKKRSGTGCTINYAKKKGKPVILIDPDSFQTYTF